jgi:phospholipase C
MNRARIGLRSTLRTALSLLLALTSVAPAPLSLARAGERGDKLQKINHFVVIYQENHSFDNLYGGWERVRGLKDADPAHTVQVSQGAQPYECLLQNDVNLTSPPLAATCTEVTGGSFMSAFVNAPFLIDNYILATDNTCPPPGVFAPNGVLKDAPGALPGGCTRDLVHRFYQEQYQIDGGRMDRYVTGSDAVGLAMGHYDTTRLPIYQYLHAPRHPKYAIADNFFQAAFGGSFLNHHWLIAAATPVFAGAVQDGSSSDLHSIVDVNGFPSSYPLYTPATTVKDSQLTVKCPAPVPGLACGDYAVNTTQPWFQPFAPGTAAARRLPPLTTPTMGDRLTAAGIDWAWYSGGWSNANGDIGAPGWTNGTSSPCSDPKTIGGAVFPNCADKLFQFHHQPFNYYAAFDPTTAAGSANRQAHLRDEAEFLQLATSSTQATCNLKPVSFVKPIGEQNEHPGYTSESTGSDHLVELIDAITKTACAKDTMIIVTYDEFGGQWDHVPPPGSKRKSGESHDERHAGSKGNSGGSHDGDGPGTEGLSSGPHDEWGPGTRVPTLIVTPFLRGSFVVDHTSYDTTSILATLERRYGLPPLGTRDAAIQDLSKVFGD